MLNDVIEVFIPVRPHYKKFFEKEFKSRLSLKDPMGIVIYHMLRKNDSMSHSPDVLCFPIKRDQMSTSITVEIPKYYIFDHALRTSVTDNDARQFNYILHENFKFKFLVYVDSESRQGKEVQSAIYSFMNEYGITHNDITFDALKKTYYRHRMEKQKISPKKVSHE